MSKTLTEKVTAQRDKQLAIAADCVERSVDGVMPTNVYDAYKTAMTKAQAFAEQLTMLTTVETATARPDAGLEMRSATVTVKSEPRTYTAEGENSYFLDLAKRNIMGDAGAIERLKRYSQEVDSEIRSGSSEGVRAARVVAEYRREPSTVERRAMSSSSSSGGDFVTPQYLVNLWVPYRSPDRSFTNQCTNLPMPSYGLTFNVPAFSSPAPISQQATENSSIEGPPPSAANGQTNPADPDLYQTATLTTQAGAFPISQQLFDRGGYEGSGGAFDSIVYLQAKSQLDAQIDTYILTQVLLNAFEVNQSTSATVIQFYLDLATARNALQDANGVKLPGTHVFSTGDFAAYIASQVDSDGRPIVVPDAAALASRADDVKWAGWLGLVLPGNLRWFSDDNIYAATPPATDTTILVGSPADTLLWEGDPITFAYPETRAGELSVMLGIRAYVAAVSRHNEAFAYITGSGYPTSLV